MFHLQMKTENVRKETKKEVLKWNWSNFHLSSLDGVGISLPVILIDSIGIRWVLPMMIKSIQIRIVAVLVPPGSFKGHSTITRPVVIVLIFGWKGMATMRRKRIAGSSWKSHPKSIRRVWWWLNCTRKSEFNKINFNSLSYFQSGPES